MIIDSRGLSVSININHEKQANLLNLKIDEKQSRQKTTFMKIQFNSNKIGAMLSKESKIHSFIMNSFSVKHLNKEIIGSQIKESETAKNISVDEMSNQSSAINKSVSEYANKYINKS